MGGALLGLGRGLLLASILLFAMGLSGLNYCKGSLDSSFSAVTVQGVAPGVFAFLDKGIFSKFAGSEKKISNPA